MFIAYKYSVILKCILHDFPAFALFSHTKVQMSEGTFCRVEVHIYTVLARNKTFSKFPQMFYMKKKIKRDAEIRTRQLCITSLAFSPLYHSGR